MQKTGYWVVVIALFLTSCLSACSQAESTPVETSVISVEVNAKSIVDAKCTTCHGLDKLSGQVRDTSGWTTVVKRMDKKGNIGLSADEITAVSAYLAENYK